MTEFYPARNLVKKASLPVRLFCIALLSAIKGQGEEQLYTFKEPHMGIEFTIRSWAEEGQVEDLTLLTRDAFARIAALNRSLSDYLPESEINELAKAPSGEPVPVSEDLFVLFEKAGQLTAETDGAFDITAGPIIRLWRMGRKNRALPTVAQIASAKARTGFHHLVLDPEKRTILKKIDGMLFDLGGIAKGYAADAALAILKEGGFPRTLIAASGDIVVGDAPPGETGWRIGIETLEIGHDLKDLEKIILVNAAISTSGDTRRYLELDGVRYSHIVSTRTGLGLTERIGASVIAPDATTSDSYATAVVLLGTKEGLQFIENKRGIECQIVALRDGNEVFTHSDGFLQFQGTNHQKEGPFAAP
jgi:thiamine biosynthesis lipoprotein